MTTTRRELLTLLASTAAVEWPGAVWGQQERMRRVGVLMSIAADDPEGQRRLRVFQNGMHELGWTEGRNLEIITRWGAGEPNLIRNYASELIALAPDVILATGSATVGPLLQMTGTVPIVFVFVADPVGAGFVSSMARPGANATGFMPFEYATASKWLELLKQIAPSVTRAAVIRDPGIATGLSQFAAIQAVGPSLGIEVTPVGVKDAEEIERGIAPFSQVSNSGAIVTGSALATRHRDLIIGLAAKHKLPTVYFERHFVDAGGLISFGANVIDQYRHAVDYVDRVLKGERPADLPVQAPTRYELVINLKTARALGLTIPPTLLARADEVIE
jgi:ABC-type uncharacterized transport system substrate-binding protein